MSRFAELTDTELSEVSVALQTTLNMVDALDEGKTCIVFNESVRVMDTATLAELLGECSREAARRTALAYRGNSAALTGVARVAR